MNAERALHEPVDRREVEIDAGEVRLPGDLAVPRLATGAVIFAHGSGSSRRSPRNMAVGRTLNEAGLGTILFDLLTPVEAEDRAKVFDIPLLAGRLAAATRWLRERPGMATIPVGYFGASTGAGAALMAAAELGSEVSAVVSRGGRPDLAGPVLELVTAPTLLIVGGRDEEVFRLNRAAQRQLRCPTRLEIVPLATHLFEEPGALETVADLASDWFVRRFEEAARVA
ncbi:MAG: hypothetical protein HYU54_02360 [Actinobacteria bacterium]|nr:hypothetical protein [Actinomycetota bacterium]